LQGPPLSMRGWFDAVEARSATPVKPRWPDLQVGPSRYSLR
jgi:hypothetical protein